MKELEKDYEPGETRLFIYRLGFNVIGYVNSDAPEEYTKEAIEEFMKENYPDGVQLLDFRQATDEETEVFHELYTSEGGLSTPEVLH